jgi:hypothetical protein
MEGEAPKTAHEADTKVDADTKPTDTTTATTTASKNITDGADGDGDGEQAKHAGSKRSHADTVSSNGDNSTKTEPESEAPASKRPRADESSATSQDSATTSSSESRSGSNEEEEEQRASTTTTTTTTTSTTDTTQHQQLPPTHQQHYPQQHHDPHAAHAAAHGYYDPYSQAYGHPGADYSHMQQYAQPQQQQPQQTPQPLPESMADDPPSKVIHFRNVTNEITQEDIMELATPFGQVEKIVMMRTKNQCLLEFKDLANAIMMSNFYVNTQPQVRGRKVYMRFSRHQALTGTNINVNKVLLVTLQMDQEPTIPITADIVWHIFSTYGFIEKIVVINKGGGLQALIQYSSPVSGSSASQYLNGKTVYVGTDPILAITLYIQYSHLQQLTVRTNTSQARDYTMPLPWGAQPYYGGGYGGYDQSQMQPTAAVDPYAQGYAQYQQPQQQPMAGQGVPQQPGATGGGGSDHTADLYALAQQGGRPYGQ